MEKNNIKIKITTISTGNPVSVIKGNGVFREKNGKVLINHIDEENNKTAVIITDEKMLLSRSSEMYSYKIPIKAGETLQGLIGEEQTFTVVGKHSAFNKHKKGGNIEIEYTLPDLADESMDFKVNIDFEY